ncbi:hypothetical protein AAC387_Pa06g1405 [Persea americana]
MAMLFLCVYEEISLIQICLLKVDIDPDPFRGGLISRRPSTSAIVLRAVRRSKWAIAPRSRTSVSWCYPQRHGLDSCGSGQETAVHHRQLLEAAIVAPLS